MSERCQNAWYPRDSAVDSVTCSSAETCRAELTQPGCLSVSVHVCLSFSPCPQELRRFSLTQVRYGTVLYMLCAACWRSVAPPTAWACPSPLHFSYWESCLLFETGCFFYVCACVYIYVLYIQGVPKVSIHLQYVHTVYACLYNINT